MGCVACMGVIFYEACMGYRQWRIYIEDKEAVLGAPGLKGPPNL